MALSKSRVLIIIIVPLKVVVCVLGNRNTLGVLYISYSVVDDQRHK